MKLEHGFPTEVREIFRYHQNCFKCGKNANAGLEIHHVCGRLKHENYLSSVLNASVLCKSCHDHIDGSFAERLYLLKCTVNILRQENYQFQEIDILFLKDHAREKYGMAWRFLVDNFILKP